MKQFQKESDTEKAISYKDLKVTSDAFHDGEMIPIRFTSFGENVNPPLKIDNIPKEALTLMIVAEDMDSPIRPWTHWLAWNIPVTHHIKINEMHGVHGLNDFQYLHYTGPCPISGTHRYVFKIYALDTVMDLPYHIHKYRLLKETSSHIIGYGELTGIYTKKETHFSDWIKSNA